MLGSSVAASDGSGMAAGGRLTGRQVGDDAPTEAWMPVIVGQEGGDTNGVATLMEHVVLGAGPRLLVLDVSEGTPREVWRSDVLSDVVADVAIDGDLAYAVFGHDLRILDLGRPEAPALVGGLQLRTLDAARRIVVHDGFAYVGLESLSPSGIAIVDVRDPRAPRRVDADGWFVVGAREAAASGNRLYVVPDLRVVDISDPANASVVGSLELEDNPWTVAARGDLVYACGRSRLYAIDAADASRLEVLGSIALDGGPLAVDNDHVHVAGRGGGLQLVDASDPRRLRLASTAPLEGGATEIVAAQGRLLAVVPGVGLRGFPLEEHAAPSAYGFDVWSHGSDVQVRGARAFVAAREGGMAVVDVADPSHPRTIEAVALDGAALRLALAGDEVMVATEADGVAIVSLPDRAAPTIVGRVASDEPEPVLAAEGDALFLLEPNAERLRVFDVSDPATPVETDAMDAPGWQPSDALVRDGWLFVADRDTGLRVLDGRDRSRVVPAGRVTHTTPSYSHGLALAGDRIYGVRSNPLRGDVALSPCCPPPPPPADDELVEIDVSVPATPRRLQDMGPVGWPKGVAVVGDWVLVPSALGRYHGSTLHAVSVSTGRAVSIRLPAIPSAVASGGGRAYIVTTDGGLLVVSMVQQGTATATSIPSQTPSGTPTAEGTAKPSPHAFAYLPWSVRGRIPPPPVEGTATSERTGTAAVTPTVRATLDMTPTATPEQTTTAVPTTSPMPSPTATQEPTVAPPLPVEHRYLLLEHWRHEERGPGCPGLMIDFPTYFFDPVTGVLRAWGNPRLEATDVGYYASGTSLSGSGGGAASGLKRIETLPFQAETLRLDAVSEAGAVTIERQGVVLELLPGAERRWVLAGPAYEPGCVVTATIRITNFGYQDRRKIELVGGS